jgi:hypothetical protein
LKTKIGRKFFEKKGFLKVFRLLLAAKNFLGRRLDHVTKRSQEEQRVNEGALLPGMGDVRRSKLISALKS